MFRASRFVLSIGLIAIRFAAAAGGMDHATAGAIYLSRCSACHDHPREQIPSRSALAMKPRERIVQALTSGLMKQMAAGLTSREIDSLADYLIADTSAGQSGSPGPGLNANRCVNTGTKLTPGHGDWNGWSPDLENTRFQAEPGLSVEDLARLKPKWVYAYPGSTVLGPPSVIGGRVYVGTDTGSVVSLDAATGCTVWATRSGVFAKSVVMVGAGPSVGPQYLAYFSGPNGQVHAVNAETGDDIWTGTVSTEPLLAIGESPRLFSGRVYVPLRSAEGTMGPRGEYPCCTVRGGIAAFEAQKGELIWRGYTIPEEPKPFKRNSVGTQMYGPAGAGVWSPVTIDTQLGVLYVGSAESRTDVKTDGSDAIIAFDMKTGARRWAMQATVNDSWTWGCEGQNPGPNCPTVLGPDADFASPPILQKLPGGHRVLVGAQKSGVVHGLDPDSEGKVLWRRDLAADAHIPAGVVLRDREQFGIVFGMAADATKLYVAIADPDKTAGHIPLGVYALDLTDGHILWHTPGARIPSCSWGVEGCMGAQRTAVAAMPGAVFAGSSNGHIRAYSSTDGRVLWDFDTARRFEAVNGGIAHGGAIEGSATIISHGVVYVMSGYASYGEGAGNALIAFTVDGK